MSQPRQPGINELEAYLKSCSEDTRKLFENECSVMLECRVCRNVFRGFANFCSHKRRYCRSEMHDETPVDASNSSYKKVGGLRRTNMVKRLMQKSEVPESSSEDVRPPFLHTLPGFRRHILAVVGPDGKTKVQLPPKEPTPDQNSDKVLLLQPQDNPVRHPGMCLRMRLKQDVTRMVTMEEVDCVERMLQHVPNMFEAGTVRCLNPSCSDVVPFGNIKALAYHMTVKHVKRERNGKPIPCLLCSKKFMTWTFLFSHIGRRHGQVKQDHLAYRKKEADEQTGKKRPRKQKSSQSANGVRSRSLSPECSGEIRDQREMNEMDVGDGELLPKEENDDDGPPILKRAMENTDDDDDDVGCSASSRQGSSHEEDRQESKRLKIKRSRTAPAVTSIEGSAEQGKDDKISPIGARERRKRKIPARYRDDNFLVVEKRPASTPPCQVALTTSKRTVSNVFNEQNIMKDVTRVMNRLLSDVADMISRKSSSPGPAAQIRTKSSRLRRKPDWMANEEFLIVDDRKCRREGSSEHTVSPVLHTKSAPIPAVEVPLVHKAPSTPTKPASQNHTAPRFRRSITSFPDPEFSPSSRRKQNLNAIEDDVDDVAIVSNNGKRGKPFDLAMVPVYLSFTQKQLFFSSLKQLDSKEPDGKHVCSQCNEVVPNLKEGRRHMVTHIRVMRLRCSLCGAGSFFCTDLRVHLMEGLCEKLHRAPAGIVKPNSIPCMTKEQADSLSELADVANPGRVMYTSGKIVSAKSRKPYYPDPVIEERILGPGRVVRRSTPTRAKRV